MVIIEIDCSKKGWISDSVGDHDRDNLLMELLYIERDKEKYMIN